MQKNILPAKRYRMLRGEHHQFHKQVLKEVKDANIPELNIYIAPYEAAIEEEGAANRIAKKWASTPTIVHLKKVRKQIALTLIEHVKADMRLENNTIRKQNARNVKPYCDAYYPEIKRGYAQSSGAIHNFINDLKNKLQNEVTALNLTDLLLALEHAHKKVKTAYNKRLDKIAEKKNIPQLLQLCKATDTKYDHLMARLETLLIGTGYAFTEEPSEDNTPEVPTEYEAYWDLANKINALIASYRRNIALRNTLNTKKRRKKEEEKKTNDSKEMETSEN